MYRSQNLKNKYIRGSLHRSIAERTRASFLAHSGLDSFGKDFDRLRGERLVATDAQCRELVPDTELSLGVQPTNQPLLHDVDEFPESSINLNFLIDLLVRKSSVPVFIENEEDHFDQLRLEIDTTNCFRNRRHHFFVDFFALG